GGPPRVSSQRQLARLSAERAAAVLAARRPDPAGGRPRHQTYPDPTLGRARAIPTGCGAVKRTRTSTPVKELAPQASASTTSAMTARELRASRREAEARRLAKRSGPDKRNGAAVTAPQI